MQWTHRCWLCCSSCFNDSLPAMEDKLDLDATCFTCLTVSARTLSVFTKDLKYELTLMNMIDAIASTEIRAYDGMPEKLCYGCAELLRSAYGFQQMCTSSYKTLLSYLENQSEHDNFATEVSHKQYADEEPTNNEGENNGTKLSIHHLSIGQSLLENPSDQFSNEECLEEALSSDTDLQVIPDNIANENHEYAILEISGTIKSDTDDDDRNDQIDDVDDAGREQQSTKATHKCTVCNRELSKYYHLKRHMLTHTKVKQFQCTLCFKQFNRSDNLLTHMLNHSSERPFSCVICKKSFKRDEHLKNHLVRHHQSSDLLNESHICTICKRCFANEANLKRHMESHHVGKEFTCEECGKQLSNKYQLTQHYRCHLVEEQDVSFLCSYCGRKFNRKDYLMIHMRRHTGETPFKCNYCDKAFARKTDLKIHEKYHTKKKDHHCATCGKTFYRKSSLTLHMKIHTGEKPHKCPHCPKQFIQKYDLQTHIRRHTGERFQCELCDEKYIHCFQLKQHVKTEHGIVLESKEQNLRTIYDERNQQDQLKPESEVVES